MRVSDLRQRNLVSFRQEQPALDLGFQDTVLRSQIFVPHQQFLIDGAGDVGQHASPVHSRALPKVDRRTRIVHALEVSESSWARKLRDWKPSLFKVFEIFDHTSKDSDGISGITLLEGNPCSPHMR